MEYLEELTSRYPVLEAVKDQVLAAYEILRDCYAGGGKVLIAGNGGSCADSEHIVGELMKGFVKRRPVSGEFAAALREADANRGEELASCLQGGLPAIALTGHAGLSTAFLNDVNGKMIYAQQLYGYGKKGDVFIGISTSGNSANVIGALQAARKQSLFTIGLTGDGGGRMAPLCDILLAVGHPSTPLVQETHAAIGHMLCALTDYYLFENVMAIKPMLD